MKTLDRKILKDFEFGWKFYDLCFVSDWWIHFICVICVFFVLASIGGLIHLVMKRVMKGPMCNSKAR